MILGDLMMSPSFDKTELSVFITFNHMLPAALKDALCASRAHARARPYVRSSVLVIVGAARVAQIQIRSQIHGGIAVSEYCWFV